MLRSFGRVSRRFVTRHHLLPAELMETADIQSLAGLCNNYAMVPEMRPVPVRPGRHLSRLGDGDVNFRWQSF
jgi:hypothetical protein